MTVVTSYDSCDILVKVFIPYTYCLTGCYGAHIKNLACEV